MKYLKPFAIGFLITAIVHILQIVSCDDGDSVSLGPTGGGADRPDITVDMQAIEKCAGEIEAAFLSGDYKQVEAIMDLSGLELYADELQNLEPDRMKSFAADFAKAELSYYGNFIVEYRFPFENTYYVVRLALQPDGSYKLSRF